MKDSPLLLLIPATILIIGTGIFFMSERQVDENEESVAVQASSTVENSTSSIKAISFEGEKKTTKKTEKPDLSRVRFQATIKAPARPGMAFARTADLFVGSTFATAGVDSRTGEVIKEDNDQVNQSESSTVVDIVFGSFYEYGSKVEVSVVGLIEGEYELFIKMIDSSGVLHEFSYASSTNEEIMDSYVFGLESGSVSISRSDYGNRNNDWIAFEDDEGYCDTSSLELQLRTLLTDKGWDMNRVDFISKKEGFVKDLDHKSLAFGYEKVCAVELNFKSERNDNDSENTWEHPGLVSLFGYAQEPRTIAGEEFYENPADGPLGTGNIIPITRTGNEVQFLSLNESTSLIPVNFPFYSVCPCSINYKTVLTAPMYPSE